MEGTALDERPLLLYSGLCLYVAINMAKFAGICGVGLLDYYYIIIISKQASTRMHDQEGIPYGRQCMNCTAALIDLQVAAYGAADAGKHSKFHRLTTIFQILTANFENRSDLLITHSHRRRIAHFMRFRGCAIIIALAVRLAVRCDYAKRHANFQEWHMNLVMIYTEASVIMTVLWMRNWMKCSMIVLSMMFHFAGR